MKPTCLDLFCGCGGFSLGMQRAGFHVLAAIDFNPEAIAVFRKNFPDVPIVLQKDLTKFSPEDLSGAIHTTEVDVIVGGPPCQGFSTVRQRDGSNSGPRIVEDDRRYLYKQFLRYVEFFQPKVFVIENVLGIRSAAGGRYFSRVQEESRHLGYRVLAKTEKAFDLGVPQKRVRQLIIGTRSDLPDYFPSELKRVTRAVKSPTLGEAIGDLPALRAGGGAEEGVYDLARRKSHVARYGRHYLHGTLEVHRATKLTAHRARPHSARDLRDFAKLKEGETCLDALHRGESLEFPYDRNSFKDRYTRQHRGELCSTIVAHLSKDGLMFIHPTQNRSLTPREAARVQSFPDWFDFPVARTHQFRLIGNAVPPLVGEAVGNAVQSYLKVSTKSQRLINFDLGPLPQSDREAADWLLQVVRFGETKSLRELSLDMFKRGWFSVGFLYPGLHPDGALEHGRETKNCSEIPDVTRIEPRLQSPYYVQSGWPLLLEPVATEAWRRYDAGELEDDEFYCSQAVIAGMCHRNSKLARQVRSERAEAS